MEIKCFRIGSTTVVSTAPEIMMSEVVLIFFVLGLWLSAIGFCLNQYKSLRRLETQVHYCVNRKDPLNIGEIKIVAREQDSIIYKKKRYSTLVDTHIDNDQLKKMTYVKEYLPNNNNFQAHSTTLSAIVIDRDDLTANVPLTTTNVYSSLGHSTTSTYIPLTTHRELAEEQQPSSPPPTTSFFLYDTDVHLQNERLALVQRIGKNNHLLLLCLVSHRQSISYFAILIHVRRNRLMRISENTTEIFLLIIYFNQS